MPNVDPPPANSSLPPVPELRREEPRTAPLERIARTGSYDEQTRAILELEALGPEAVEALLRLLEHPATHVRAHAARALGRVGDPRATTPLVQALRRGFVGGSGWGNLAIHLLVLAVVSLVVFVLLWSGDLGWGAGLLAAYFLAHAATGYVRYRRNESILTQAVTEALGQIAKRHPSAELIGVPADLRAVAADALQHTPETRLISLAAAIEIEERLAELRHLPIVASAPEAGEATLPRPAGAPDGSVEDPS